VFSASIEARVASSETSSKKASNPEGSEENRGASRLLVVGIEVTIAAVDTGGWVGDEGGVISRSEKAREARGGVGDRRGGRESRGKVGDTSGVRKRSSSTAGGVISPTARGVGSGVSVKVVFGVLCGGKG